MESSSESKIITLKSSDNENFEVDEKVISECQTIKHMIEDLDDSNQAIPLPNVTGTTLSKVIEYLKKHVDTPINHQDLNNWDAQFLKVDQNTLFDLILAANYLDIKSLLNLTCQTVADLMKDLSPEEVRKMFNITNDFTPEEEEAIRKENEWAY